MPIYTNNQEFNRCLREFRKKGWVQNCEHTEHSAQMELSESGQASLTFILARFDQFYLTQFEFYPPRTIRFEW